MIKKIILENFKGFSKKTEIPLGNLTLIYGKNSAGKSSIIHALQLLSQSCDQGQFAEPTLVFRKDDGLVDLGSYAECVNGHKSQKKMVIGCEHAVIRKRLSSERKKGEEKYDYEELATRLEYTYSFNKTRGAYFDKLHYRNLTEDKCLDGATIVYDRARHCLAWKVDRHADRMLEMVYHCLMRNIKKFRKYFEEHARPESVFEKIRYSNLAGPTRRRHFLGDDDDLVAYLAGKLKKNHPKYNELKSEAEKIVNCYKETLKFYSSEKITLSQFRKRFRNKKLAIYYRHGVGVPHRIIPGCRYNLESRMIDFSIYKDMLPDWELFENNYLDKPAYLEEKPAYLEEIQFIIDDTTFSEVEAATRPFLHRIQSMQSLQANRAEPRRYYVRSNMAGPSLGVSGENLPEYLLDNPDVTKAINQSLKDLDVRYKIIPKTIGGNADLMEIRLKDAVTGDEVCWTDVGFGISQIIPIVARLHSRRGLLTIQQPESQIHPKLQSDFTRLLAAAARRGGNRSSIIVETHSEHIVLHLQKLIRDGKFNQDHVKVLYVDVDSEGSFVTELRLNEKGQFIDRWPGGFFPERMELL